MEIPKPTIVPTIGSLLLPHNCRISGLIVGADVLPFDAVYVNANGLVYPAIGTAANAAARVRGFAAMAALVAQNDSITIVTNTEVAWANTLTPGIDLYLSGTIPGGLTDTATTGGSYPIAYVKDNYHIVLLAAR